MSKIFCIGWHKTGTTSIGLALRELGYKSCFGASTLRNHIGEDNMMKLLFQSNYEPIIDFAQNYQSFNDLPWNVLFRQLDEAYRGSKFIFTLREDYAWLQSAQGYFTDSNSAFRMWLYSQPNIREYREVFLNRYRKHYTAVLSYFADRSDLLILPLESNKKWELLCDFLELPVPLKPYPHDTKYTNKSFLND